jgi:hypothetical protein
MAEPGQDTLTMSDFVARAATASGGMVPLRRRMGVSRGALDAMSTSASRVAVHQAEHLARVLGLTPLAEPADREPTAT